MSSKDTDEEHVKRSKSDNIEIMINDKTDEVVKDVFESLLSRYQKRLRRINGIGWYYLYVHLLHFRCHK